MATEVLSTIKTSGGDYTTIAAWEADTDNDLVTANEYHIGDIYDVPLAKYFQFAGATTSIDCYRHLRVNSSVRHNGTPGSGYQMTPSVSGGYMCYVNEPFAIVEGIDLVCGAAIGIYLGTSGDNALVVACLMKITGGDGFSSTNGGADNSLFVDCLAYECSSDGFYLVQAESGGSVKCVNCTARDNTTSGFKSSTYVAYRDIIFQNCVAQGNGTDWLQIDNSLGGYNAAGNADPPGTNTVTDVAVSDFSGYGPAAGGALIDAGINAASTRDDLNRGSYSIVNDDPVGTTRYQGSAWDIGYIEFSPTYADPSDWPSGGTTDPPPSWLPSDYPSGGTTDPPPSWLPSDYPSGGTTDPPPSWLPSDYPSGGTTDPPPSWLPSDFPSGGTTDPPPGGSASYNFTPGGIRMLMCLRV